MCTFTFQHNKRKNRGDLESITFFGGVKCRTHGRGGGNPDKQKFRVIFYFSSPPPLAFNPQTALLVGKAV